MTPRRDVLTWLGFAVIGAAAVAWSFTALTDLAELLGVTERITLGDVDIRVAWGLPVSIDVFAAVATRVWLRRRSAPEALTFARYAAWAAIASTTVGNAYHGVLTGGFRLDVVVVSAVPAVALGALVHLAVLVGRAPDENGVDEPRRDPWLTLLDDVLAEPWDRAIRQWANLVDEHGRRVPTSDDADDVLVADLQAINVARDRPLVQDDIRTRYGIGQQRAARIRAAAEAPPEGARLRPVPAEEVS